MDRLLDTFGDEPRMHRRVLVPGMGSGVHWIHGELGFCLTGPALTSYRGRASVNIISRRFFEAVFVCILFAMLFGRHGSDGKVTVRFRPQHSALH